MACLSDIRQRDETTIRDSIVAVDGNRSRLTHLLPHGIIFILEKDYYNRPCELIN
jgi:hypothetical protein